MNSLWSQIDFENSRLLSFVEKRKDILSDSIQGVLDRFPDVKGFLSKKETERLHRDIEKWKVTGTSVGELRLLARDLERRNRIKKEDAMFTCFLAVFMDDYLETQKYALRIMEGYTKNAYFEAFSSAHKITETGRAAVPGTNYISSILAATMPNGDIFSNAIYADASYRTRQITKQVAIDKMQGNASKATDSSYQRIMKMQRDWQIRRVARASDGRMAGYYDMVAAFVVNTAVAKAYRDAQVEKYRFVATVDNVTTDACRALDGKVFPLEGMKLGINFPPVYPPDHPCRSTTEPVR